MWCLALRDHPDRTFAAYIVGSIASGFRIGFKCDRICENRPPCTRYQNRDSSMNDVIEVWSRSGENLEAIACIALEIRSLEPRSRLI